MQPFPRFLDGDRTSGERIAPQPRVIASANTVVDARGVATGSTSSRLSSFVVQRKIIEQSFRVREGYWLLVKDHHV